MKKKKSYLSPWKKALIAFLCVIIAVLFILTAIRLGEIIAYANFYSHAQREFDMPGTSSGFVGQGFDYDEEHECFLSCGYSATKGGASSVFVTDKDGKSHEVLLKKANGNNYTGHTGGICHYKEYFYITGGDGCDVFSLSDLYSGATETKKLGEVVTAKNDDHDPAYCSIKDGKFYVGSFYREPNYKTADWQKMTTPAGDNNTAAIKVFDLDDGAQENFYVGELSCVYSTRGLVQGMAFTEEHIVLSTSYGLATSHLYYYAYPEVGGTASVDGRDVPVRYLDSACLVKTVDAPPMSEELVYRNGRIYIMTESASNKYIFGKFMSGRYVFSYKD